MTQISGYALASIGIGGVLVWSGVKNEKITSVAKDVLTGTKPPENGPDAADNAGGGASGATPPPAPSDPSKNVTLGKLLASAEGWGTGSEWNALYDIWNHESGWSNTAQNASTGAYGIPQALPASKMGALANPPVSSAAAQIKWGLGYIKDTYGTPLEAWTHEQSDGWY
jgi:resuscitation-promoting factor RpfB